MLYQHISHYSVHLCVYGDQIYGLSDHRMLNERFRENLGIYYNIHIISIVKEK